MSINTNAKNGKQFVIIATDLMDDHRIFAKVDDLSQAKQLIDEYVSRLNESHPNDSFTYVGLKHESTDATKTHDFGNIFSRLEVRCSGAAFRSLFVFEIKKTTNPYIVFSANDRFNDNFILGTYKTHSSAKKAILRSLSPWSLSRKNLYTSDEYALCVLDEDTRFQLFEVKYEELLREWDILNLHERIL